MWMDTISIMTCKGFPVATIINGKTVMSDGKVIMKAQANL